VSSTVSPPIESVKTVQSHGIPTGAAQPVDPRRGVTVDAYKEALKDNYFSNPASFISASNILLTLVSIKCFQHDGLDRTNFIVC
jgi:hypothetical protein